LFEETGVLLARDGEGRQLGECDDGWRERLARRREDLHYARIAFPELLAEEGLFLCPEELLWLSHWVTPATSPRRFSTFFFLTPNPPGQLPSPFAGEVSHACWVRPEEALARWRAGEWAMIPPTIATLDTIARYRSWAELAADFRRPAAERPRTVFPGP
jgi:hypothetical protein